MGQNEKSVALCLLSQRRGKYALEKQEEEKEEEEEEMVEVGALSLILRKPDILI